MEQVKSPPGAFGAPGYAPAKAAAELFAGEPITEMVFPKGGITVMLRGHVRVYFPEGKQPVPESLVRHPYLLAHGVKPFDHDEAKVSREQRMQQLQAELAQLEAQGGNQPTGDEEEDEAGSNAGPTVAQLREQLDALQVKYPARARKEELQKLLADAQAAAKGGNQPTA